MFIELVNTEQTLSKDKYTLKLAATWEWEIDYSAYKPTPWTLYKNTVPIGYVEQDYEDGKHMLINFHPYGECTLYDIRYIKELTGWDIKI
jgi:hypothetical protein